MSYKVTFTVEVDLEDKEYREICGGFTFTDYLFAVMQNEFEKFEIKEVNITEIYGDDDE